MRKKSKYKPKGVRMDTMTYVLSGMQRVGQVKGAGVMLKIKNHLALTAIVQGRATRNDIDDMVAALNVTEALARGGQGSDWRAEIKQAQDALLTMTRRGLGLNDRFIFNGAEMQAVNLAMEIHDAQLDACTVLELERALVLVEREIRAQRARPIEAKETV